MIRAPLASLLLLTIVAACGGKVDAPGSATGGAGGGVNDCTRLEAALADALAAAQKCDPLSSKWQCTAMFKDACGCDVGASPVDQEQVYAAEDAFQALVSAGCGPAPSCGSCIVTKSWCDAKAKVCVTQPG